MRANHLNNFVGITCFGESHGKAMGVVIEDVRAGQEFPYEAIREAIARRKPVHALETKRHETDEFEVLSGVLDGITTGMPICIIVRNTQQQSSDYLYLKDIFRPGHADFALFKKFKIYDWRGGGRVSGRETISRVIAAGLISQLTDMIKINIHPHVIGPYTVHNFDAEYAKTNVLGWGDADNYADLLAWLHKLKVKGDTAGCIAQVRMQGVPAGLGDPVFEKLDANIAKAILSIGSVKAIEFGAGFRLGKMTGSQANDEISTSGLATNNCGGILGGVATGDEIIFRFCTKPIPSISLPQKTINTSGQPCEITITGRHDTIILARLKEVIISMLRIVLADAIASQNLQAGKPMQINNLREAIDKVDEDIILAIARRNKLAFEIGKIKKKNNISVEDTQREQTMLKALKEKAATYDIDSETVEKIWLCLWQESKRQQ